jgi:hypothetical protein
MTTITTMPIKLPFVIGFVLGISALGSGCGSGHGTAAAMVPLTDTQKATVKSTASNLSAITSTAGNAETAASQASTPNATATASTSTATSTSSVSAQQQQMLSVLTSNSACSFAPVISNVQGGTTVSSVDMKISGSGCPVSVDYTSSWAPVTNGQMTGKLDMTYAALTDSMRRLNDIDNETLHMDFSTSSDYTAGTISLKAKIHSQTVGAIKYAMSSSMDGKTQSIELIYQFSTFTADIKATADARGNNPVITINGQPINETEAQAYFFSPGLTTGATTTSAAAPAGTTASTN